MIHGLMFTSASALPEARAVQDPRAARDEQSDDIPSLHLSPPRESDIRDRKLAVGFTSSSFHYTFDILSTSSVREQALATRAGQSHTVSSGHEDSLHLQHFGQQQYMTGSCQKHLLWSSKKFSDKLDLGASFWRLCIRHEAGICTADFGITWKDEFLQSQVFRRLHWAATTLISSSLPSGELVLQSSSTCTSASIEHTSFNRQALINGFLHVRTLRKWIFCNRSCCIEQLLRNISHTICVRLLCWFFTSF